MSSFALYRTPPSDTKLVFPASTMMDLSAVQPVSAPLLMVLTSAPISTAVILSVYVFQGMAPLSEGDTLPLSFSTPVRVSDQPSLPASVSGSGALQTVQASPPVSLCASTSFFSLQPVQACQCCVSSLLQVAAKEHSCPVQLISAVDAKPIPTASFSHSSALPSKLTLLIFVVPSKAPAPMLSTLSGIKTLVRFSLPAKA